MEERATEADMFGNISKKLSKIIGSRDTLRCPIAALLAFYLTIALDVIDSQHECRTRCVCGLRCKLLWCVCFCPIGSVFAIWT